MVNVALITGVTGQDGSYLAELLLDKDYFVYGIVRRTSQFNTQRIEHLRTNERFHYVYGDVTDPFSLGNAFQLIDSHHPSVDRVEVYNLAAQSHVRVSFDLPDYTAQVDALGTLRILEMIRGWKHANKTRFYQASTSELYGDVLEIPQTERTPFNPQSPYAIAKLYSFYITKNYRDAYGMFACNGILFNHESERRGPTFVTRKITLGIGEILNAQSAGDDTKILELGNLDAKRDWGHAKDYVYGMYLMLQTSTPDDYVLSTGEQYSVREFVERAFNLCGITIKWRGESIHEEGYDESTGRVYVKINPKYFRPTEVETLLGDSSKARTVLGWTPKISFGELVERMVNEDVKRV